MSYSLSTFLLSRAAEDKFLYTLNQTGSPHSSPMGQALSSSVMLPTEIGIMWKRSVSSLFLERLHLEGQVDAQESSNSNNPDGFPAGILHWHCQKYGVVFSASQLRCFTPHYYYSPEKIPRNPPGSCQTSLLCIYFHLVLEIGMFLVFLQ